MARMMSFAFLVVGLALGAVPLCLADIVTSVAGSLSASGQVSVSFLGEDSNSFSFSDSNTNPIYNFSKSDSTSSANDFETAGAGATLTQNVALSAGHLSTDIEADDGVYGSNIGAVASVNASNANTVMFDSSSPFRFDLAVDGSDSTSGFGTSEDALNLELSGPDFSFEEHFGLGENGDDESWILQPGVYTLSESAALMDLEGGIGGGLNASLSLQVDADFAAVPEPRGISILVTGLLMVLLALRAMAPFGRRDRRFAR
jgi:hypothetical protein